MREFDIHHRLLADSYVLGDALISRVLLAKDARYPWLILVPRLAGMKDLHEIPIDRRNELFADINSASLTVKSLICADKVNVAALGNQVPQLHIHVIGRLTTDYAWPGSVWGVGKPKNYDPMVLDKRRHTVITSMNLSVGTQLTS